MSEAKKEYYMMRPCKGTVGFVATLRKNTRLDLKQCALRLKSAGYDILDAEVMLIANKDVELTIYKSGKILVKTDNEKTAKGAVEQAYSILMPPP